MELIKVNLKDITIAHFRSLLEFSTMVDCRIYIKNLLEYLNENGAFRNSINWEFKKDSNETDFNSIFGQTETLNPKKEDRNIGSKTRKDINDKIKEDLRKEREKALLKQNEIKKPISENLSKNNNKNEENINKNPTTNEITISNNKEVIVKKQEEINLDDFFGSFEGLIVNQFQLDNKDKNLNIKEENKKQNVQNLDKSLEENKRKIENDIKEKEKSDKLAEEKEKRRIEEEVRKNLKNDEQRKREIEEEKKRKKENEENQKKKQETKPEIKVIHQKMTNSQGKQGSQNKTQGTPLNKPVEKPKNVNTQSNSPKREKIENTIQSKPTTIKKDEKKEDSESKKVENKKKGNPSQLDWDDDDYEPPNIQDKENKALINAANNALDQMNSFLEDDSFFESSTAYIDDEKIQEEIAIANSLLMQKIEDDKDYKRYNSLISKNEKDYSKDDKEFMDYMVDKYRKNIVEKETLTVKEDRKDDKKDIKNKDASSSLEKITKTKASFEVISFRTSVRVSTGTWAIDDNVPKDTFYQLDFGISKMKVDHKITRGHIIKNGLFWSFGEEVVKYVIDLDLERIYIYEGKENFKADSVNFESGKGFRDAYESIIKKLYKV